ncbi:MAG: PilN domain-containing protein [Deltaproteobacteria bacterium]|nr:PilN domain-containing protein [Deltaproteobacteria bacterium]
MLLDRNSIGIDISDSRLALVWTQTRIRSCKLIRHGELALAEGEEKPSQEKLKQIADFVNAFIDENNIASPEIYISIPAGRTIVRTISFPLTVKENFRETIRFEMEKYVPFPENQLYYDCQIVDEDKNSKLLTILLIVIKKEDLDPYLQMGKELKSGVSGIEITPTALTNALSCLAHLAADTPCAYFHPRGENSMLCLINRNKLLSTRTIPGRIDAPLSELLSPEIKLCQNYNLLVGRRLQVLAGSDTVTLPPKKENDQVGDIQHLKLDGSVPSVTFLAAYGLAVRGLRRLPGQINLMPPSLRKRPDRKSAYILSALIILNILLLITWTGSLMMHRRMTGERLDGEIARMSAMVADLDEIEKNVTESEKKIDSVNNFQHVRPYTLDILLELARTIPETAWVENFHLANTSVEIGGFADSASELIPLLEGSEIFHDVAFLSTISKSNTGKENFKIQFSIKTVGQ